DSAPDLWLYVGIAILIVTTLVTIALYLYLFDKEVYTSPKQLLIIALSCIITLLLCVLTRQITLTVGETQIYVMPVTLGILLITLLIKGRVALFINMPLSIIASMLSGTSGSFFNISTYTMVISSFVSGCVALRILKRRQTRLSVLLAGAVAGLAGIVASFSVAMISSSSIRDSLYISLFSGIGGPLSALICIALVPAFEAVFNVITTTRLLEMSNPNQPLLRRLLLEAPGTYHHSIIVANLAEAAAGEVGANSLLARVGSYYHDVGKLMRPAYFTENQMGDNPHDRTDPRVSTAIITAHPKDGVQLMKEHRIPEEIINIAQRHHGDTPVVYFYNKALASGEPVDRAAFCYPGPKPRSRETALLMIVDSTEAAVRSEDLGRKLMGPRGEEPAEDGELGHPNRGRGQAVLAVQELVARVVGSKMEEGQFDEADLTLRDISRIEEALCSVLLSMYHSRKVKEIRSPSPQGQEGGRPEDASPIAHAGATTS
ncbi:MAG: HDIG domain-containing protein, partial [Synergistaceae bacterium]|nr:HDIG domain-containing protein [Synergistaceae bacterium]